jgi:hypothetical protein
MGSNSSKTEIRNVVSTKISSYVDNMYKTINSKISSISSNQISKQKSDNYQNCSSNNQFSVNGDVIISGHSRVTNDQRSFASCALKSTADFSSKLELRNDLIAKIQESVTGDTSLKQSIAQMQKAMTNASKTDKNTGGFEGVINDFTDKAFSMFKDGKDEKDIENTLTTDFESHVSNTTDIENSLKQYFQNKQKDSSENVCGVRAESNNAFTITGNLKVLDYSELIQNQTSQNNALGDCVAKFINVDGMLNHAVSDDSFAASYKTLIENQSKNSQDTQSDASETKIQDNVINEGLTAVKDVIQGLMKNIVIVIIVICVVIVVAILFFIIYKTMTHKHQVDNNFTDYYGPSSHIAPLSATPMGPSPLPMGPPPTQLPMGPPPSIS